MFSWPDSLTEVSAPVPTSKRLNFKILGFCRILKRINPVFWLEVYIPPCSTVISRWKINPGHRFAGRGRSQRFFRSGGDRRRHQVVWAYAYGLQRGGSALVALTKRFSQYLATSVASQAS